MRLEPVALVDNDPFSAPMRKIEQVGSAHFVGSPKEAEVQFDAGEASEDADVDILCHFVRIIKFWRGPPSRMRRTFSYRSSANHVQAGTLLHGRSGRSRSTE